MFVLYQLSFYWGIITLYNIMILFIDINIVLSEDLQ